MAFSFAGAPAMEYGPDEGTDDGRNQPSAMVPDRPWTSLWAPAEDAARGGGGGGSRTAAHRKA